VELLEQLEVQVADLLLRDGNLWIDWVEPGIFNKAVFFILRGKAGLGKGRLIGNFFERIDEFRALRKDIRIVVTEVVHVGT
jgi:hypothetical protein